MNTWEGWSTHWPQVHLSCVLAALLTGVHTRITTSTVHDTLHTLPCTPPIVTLHPARVAAQLITEPALFTPTGPAGPAETRLLKPTARGARVAAEFRAAQESLTRHRMAQRTILRCCAAHPATEFLTTDSILAEPLSWLYGAQFRFAELTRAAAALTEAGLLFTVGPGALMQLTALGQLCVERHDSDPGSCQPPTEPLSGHSANAGKVSGDQGRRRKLC